MHLDEPVWRGHAGAAAQAEPRPGHGPLSGHDVRGRGHGRQHVGALRRLDGGEDRGRRLGPHDETIEIQDFLADHEDLFSRQTANDLAVIASPASSLVAQALDGALQAQIDPATGRRRQGTDRGVSLFGVLEELAGAGHPLDVVVFHDGRIRADDLVIERLQRYRRVVLPDCTALTERQARVLLDYLELGGALTIFGELDASGEPGLVTEMRDHPRSRSVVSVDAELLSPERQVTVTGVERAALNLQRTLTGVALHMIVYDHDDPADRSRQARDVSVSVRLPFIARAATLFRPGAKHLALEVALVEDSDRVSFSDVTGYAIVAFES